MARLTWAGIMQETGDRVHGIALVLAPEMDARLCFDLVARYIRHSRPERAYALRITRQGGTAEIVAAFVERVDAEAFAAVVDAASGTDREDWASWRQVDFDQPRLLALEALAPRPKRRMPEPPATQ